MTKLTPKEEKEQQERLQGLIEKEVDGKAFMAVITYVAEEKREGSSVSQGYKTMRISNVNPAETDFMTFKGLMTSIHFQINQYVNELFPKPVMGAPKQEQGTQYG